MIAVSRQRKRKKWLWHCAALALLTTATVAAFWPYSTVLVISANETGDTLWQRDVSVGDTFAIRFTHSVARTDVDDVIRVGDGELVVDATIYESFGAGLPDSVHGEETIALGDGKVMIRHLGRALPQIDLFIGQVVANHRLVFSDEVIPFARFSPPGTSVRLSLEKQNFVTFIGRCLRGR